MPMPRLAWLALVPCLLLSGCFSLMSQGDNGSVKPAAVALDVVTLPVQVVAVAGEGVAYYGGEALRGPSREEIMAKIKADLDRDPAIIKDKKWLDDERKMEVFRRLVADDKQHFSREQMEFMATPGFLKNGKSFSYMLLYRHDLPADMRSECVNRLFSGCMSHPSAGAADGCDIPAGAYFKVPDIFERIRRDCPHRAGIEARRAVHLKALLEEQATIARQLALDPDLMLSAGWTATPSHKFFFRKYIMRIGGLGHDLASINRRWDNSAPVQIFAAIRLNELHLRIIGAEALSDEAEEADYFDAFRSFPYSYRWDGDEADRLELATEIGRRKDCPSDLKRALILRALDACSASRGNSARGKCVLNAFDFREYPDLVGLIAKKCRHGAGEIARGDLALVRMGDIHRVLLLNPDLMLSSEWYMKPENRLYMRQYGLNERGLNYWLKEHGPEKDLHRYLPALSLDERHFAVLAQEALSSDPADDAWDDSVYLVRNSVQQTRQNLAKRLFESPSCPADLKNKLRKRLP